MIQNVLVLFGGVSTEHEISQMSAANIVKGLRQAGFTPHLLGISRQGSFIPFILPDDAITDPDWETHALKALDEQGRSPVLQFSTKSGFSVRDLLEALVASPLDMIFPAVHGINCEDGTLQGLMEMSGLPYVGSDVLASAVCMDKELVKRLIRLENIPQVHHICLKRDNILGDIMSELDYVCSEMAFPCFVKPANGGSSVGAVKAENEIELKNALEQAARFDDKVLVEEFVPAIELEVAVLGNENPIAGAVGQVSVAEEGAYYDYESKYLSDDAAAVLVPAPIDEELSERLRAMAIRVYKALGCSGLSRVDFFLRKGTEKVYFNEINTLPGFTAISIFPKAFEYAGISLGELICRLCHLAERQKQRRQRETGRDLR